MNAENSPDKEAPKKTGKSKNALKVAVSGLFLAMGAFCCGALSVGVILTIGKDKTPQAQAPITQLAVTRLAVIESAVTQVAVTQVAITQVISGPTFTPLPTFTNPPPPPPEIVFVTPTFPPDWTQMWSFQGHGKHTTDLFHLDSGLVRIKWNYFGNSIFAFYLKRFDNSYEELLENAIGNVSGQRILKVESSDRYAIDVIFGDGTWEINIEFMPE